MNSWTELLSFGFWPQKPKEILFFSRIFPQYFRGIFASAIFNFDGIANFFKEKNTWMIDSYNSAILFGALESVVQSIICEFSAEWLREMSEKQNKISFGVSGSALRCFIVKSAKSIEAHQNTKCRNTFPLSEHKNGLCIVSFRGKWIGVSKINEVDTINIKVDNILVYSHLYM